MYFSTFDIILGLLVIIFPSISKYATDCILNSPLSKSDSVKINLSVNKLEVSSGVIF